MNTDEKIENKPVLHTKTVGLRFPLSTCETDEVQVFKMGYNTAMKSAFLSGFIEDDEDESGEQVLDYQEVIIPASLYRNIRYWDICKMIKLWKGESVYHGNYQDSYCYEDIARLTQSLLLDRKLNFVSLLEYEYPPNEVRSALLRHEESHRKELEELQREISGLHEQLQSLVNTPPPLHAVPPLVEM